MRARKHNMAEARMDECCETDLDLYEDIIDPFFSVQKSYDHDSPDDHKDEVLSCWLRLLFIENHFLSHLLLL